MQSVHAHPSSAHTYPNKEDCLQSYMNSAAINMYLDLYCYWNEVLSGQGCTSGRFRRGSNQSPYDGVGNNG